MLFKTCVHLYFASHTERLVCVKWKYIAYYIYKIYLLSHDLVLPNQTSLINIYYAHLFWFKSYTIAKVKVTKWTESMFSMQVYCLYCLCIFQIFIGICHVKNSWFKGVNTWKSKVTMNKYYTLIESFSENKFNLLKKK